MKVSTLVQHAPGYKMCPRFVYFAQGVSFPLPKSKNGPGVRASLNLKDHNLFLRENYTFLRHSFVDQPSPFILQKPFSPLHPYTQDTEIGLGALV